MQQFSNQEIAKLKSNLEQINTLLGNRAPDEAGVTLPDAIPDRAAPDPDLIDRVAFNVQMRRMRKSHFGGAPLGGPSWDMLLDLMLAHTHGRDLSASDLATGAAVPLSSGLRMIAALEQYGLAQRSIDEKDRRRTLVRLTDSGTERMAAYFDKVGHAWANRHRRPM
jgi:DNA-binding MarR family transcriptional regulator